MCPCVIVSPSKTSLWVPIFRVLDSYFPVISLKQGSTRHLKRTSSLSTWRGKSYSQHQFRSQGKDILCFSESWRLSHKTTGSLWRDGTQPGIWKSSSFQKNTHLLLPSKLVVQNLLSRAILNGDVLRKWDGKAISINSQLSRHLYPTVSLRLTLHEEAQAGNEDSPENPPTIPK